VAPTRIWQPASVTTSLALLASLIWGAADFLGGTVARRMPVLGVVLVSQGFALVGMIAVATLAGSWDDGTGYLAWAIAAAVVGIVALTSFYAALAGGTMGVVAPIAGLGVVVPVAVGVAQGDRPSAWQGLGVAIAAVGVVLAGGPDLRRRPGRRGDDGGRGGRRPIVLAVVAAIGFGTVLVCVAHGARSSTVMTLLVMRVTSVALIGAVVVGGRAAVSIQRSDLTVLALIGAGDVGANAAMAVASTHGSLSVVAVLSSLYPAVTVLLARAVHHERLQRVQTIGVVGALAGVVLIASGGGVSA
jgi:drug/metabolite transporter (DMT)-like permease